MVKEINLNHICKIEGHAHLNLKIENNLVKQCELKASEGARFFEGLVINKNIEDIQEIVSRICGICSSAHSVASIQAIETALNIKPDEKQKIIRELLMMGERIRSHTTHLYFLSLPDYFNADSALALGKEHQSKINDALTLITLGNKIVEIFGGREMHPFLKVKESSPKTDLSPIKQHLIDSKPTIIKTINIFKRLEYPNITRETDYLSLKEKDFYTTISGKINSSAGSFDEQDYKKHLVENIKEYATSKFVTMTNKPYMLGSMSRINNNHGELDPESKKHLEATLKDMKLSLPLKNPYYNLICQAIELMHSVNRSIELIDRLEKLETKDHENKEAISIIERNGVSAVEAPRGTLFHEYKISPEGKITYCNIITPTAQNLNMMETDITQLVNLLLKERSGKNKIVQQIEKLIRAYDPCFSCSTHFLTVNWL